MDVVPNMGPLLRTLGSLVVAASAGCAHGAAVPVDPVAQDQLDALRRDNAAMRRHVADLEDRVVRLEVDTGRGADTGGRDLPVVRLAPPRGASARTDESRHDDARSDVVDEVAAARKARQRVPARSLGDLPNSGTPEGGDAPTGGWDDGGASAASAPRNDDAGGSYRLVGDRLVELTKRNAPTQPDRPKRDAAGTAIVTEYEAAMALYKAGEVAGAERAFDMFARAHAQHDYADNALYWKGEAAYDQQHFDDALAAFTEVVERYGGGNKAPDALLKIGLCYGRLGDAANARDVLSGLVDAYPDARASDLARARLAETEG